MFGGCHLTRKIPDTISSAGFAITDLDQFYEQAGPKPMSALSLGTATSP
jgi:hypothetical protein